MEFYPEEGKYHYTGHRSCGVKYTPEDSKRNGTICPKCGKGLTVGVMERVDALASRENEELDVHKEGGIIKSTKFPDRAGYRMLVPLLQVIAEALNSAPNTQKVLSEYKKLIGNLGNEMKILTKVSLEEIAQISGPKIAEGIGKDRRGELTIDPGYDGVYGVVKIWGENEEKTVDVPQMSLFD